MDLTHIKPQRANANKHTPRGMKALEESIQRDGWVGAITVAADLETFDGSARTEVGVGAGFEDAIVVRSDGSKPVVVVREDIPSADDPRAKRLGIAANRVAELNLGWDADVLADLAQEDGILDGLFYEDELDALLATIGDEQWAAAMGALPDGDKAPFEQMTFTLSTEQAQTIRAAMEKARRMGAFVDTGNENGNGNAIARVCEVFLGE